MSIGVTILKRSGQDLMVLVATVLFSSETGIDANGRAVSVNVAEGVLEGALLDQRKPHVHCGCFHRSVLSSISHLLSSCALFRLVFAFAFEAYVSITT